MFIFNDLKLRTKEPTLNTTETFIIADNKVRVKKTKNGHTEKKKLNMKTANIKPAK